MKQSQFQINMYEHELLGEISTSLIRTRKNGFTLIYISTQRLTLQPDSCIRGRENLTNRPAQLCMPILVYVA